MPVEKSSLNVDGKKMIDAVSDLHESHERFPAQTAPFLCVYLTTAASQLPDTRDSGVGIGLRNLGNAAIFEGFGPGQ